MKMSLKALQLLGFITSSALVVAANAATPAPAKATDTFNPEQKKAIEHIVHDYLVTQPEVLVDASRALQQRQQQTQVSKAQAAITQHASTLFSTTSPMSGNPKGDITVVEFFDYQCIHCKEMKPVIAELLNSDKNVRVIYKDFPIFGQGSQYASLAALAANKQGKYADLYSALMKTHQPINKNTVTTLAKSAGLDMVKLKNDMESTEIKDQLKSNTQLAEALGLAGTPAFVVAKTNGTDVKKAFFIPGGVNGTMLQSFIEQARKA